MTYANDWKTNLLKVPPDIIAQHGAVSEQTVNAMLDGVLSQYHTDLAIATSGIAGPGGGTPQKPVGTVVVGVARQQNIWRQVETFHFNGQRDAVRARTVANAINMTINNLLKKNNA